MDIKQYIASGILEQYAFGLLSEADRQEVEANLQRYPELVEELHQIEFALEQYLTAQAVEPSADFKVKLDERLAAVAPEPPLPPPSGPSSNGTSLGLFGLLGLTLLSLAAAGWLYYDNYQQSAAYGQLQTELSILQEDCAETNEVNRGLLQQLRTIRQSGNQMIQLQSTGVGTADAIAAVIYNPETQTSYLDVINLAPLNADQQYQLWAIVEGVGPRSMGVFDGATEQGEALLEVPFYEKVQAFAVTIEPRGGSEQPTLEQMVVIGQLG